MTDTKPDIDVAVDGTVTANTPAGERFIDSVRPTPLVELLHDAPCELSKPENWRQSSRGFWSAAGDSGCTCEQVAEATENLQATADKAQKVLDAIDAARAGHRESLVASGGWRAPSETSFPVYDFGEVTARRGGISFTAPPKPLEELTHEELLTRAKALRDQCDRLVTSLNKERTARRKAERKVKRLLKIIERNL